MFPLIDLMFNFPFKDNAMRQQLHLQPGKHSYMCMCCTSVKKATKDPINFSKKQKSFTNKISTNKISIVSQHNHTTCFPFIFLLHSQ